MLNIIPMIGNILRKIKSWLIFFRLPIFSGVLIGTSYIPFPPWSSLFALVPLWYFFWQNPNPRHVFWGGWITGFVLSAIGFYWVAHTVHEFGHMSWALSLIVLFIFCSVAHLYFAFSGWLWAKWMKRMTKTPKVIALLLLPLIFALFEYYFPVIFVWNFGYTWLYSGLPVFHLAEWIGFNGLSVWVILSNLGLFLSILLFQQKKNFWPPLLTVIAVFLAFNGIGKVIEMNVPTPDGKVSILAVQANIGNLEKQFAEKGWGFRDHIIERYTQLTSKEVASHPLGVIDFALWPETAFPEQILPSLSINNHYTNRLIHFIQSQRIPLVTGAYSQDEKKQKATNSLFSFAADGSLYSSPYHKTILLAFGEYLPFGDTFPFLKSALQEVADFAHGPGPTLMQQKDIRLGAQICYEGLFPYFSKKLADLGAQIIINVTNDSWYGRSSEPHQHMYMTLARAIETRLPVVRATNTGFTTAITAKGEIMERSPLYTEWTHVYQIPYLKHPSPTFFQRVGIYLLPIFLWVLLGLAVGGSIYYDRIRKS